MKFTVSPPEHRGAIDHFQSGDRHYIDGDWYPARRQIRTLGAKLDLDARMLYFDTEAAAEACVATLDAAGRRVTPC